MNTKGEPQGRPMCAPYLQEGHFQWSPHTIHFPPKVDASAIWRNQGTREGSPEVLTPSGTH